MTDASLLNSKRVIYVGGLADEPMDYVKGKTKGFAFVEFEEADDATEAIFNRNGANLMGRTLQVSMAQANQANKLTEAVWNSDEWFQQQQNEAGGEENISNKTTQEEQDVLKGK